MKVDLSCLFEESSNNSNQLSGCYVVNKPELIKQNAAILVPLKHIRYDLEIINSICCISLSQRYFNPTQKFLELEYCFPISPSACINKFAVTFANSRIQGVVKEKEEAKKQYSEAVKQGKKAAYGEIDQHSKDIMRLRVGNVEPLTEVRVEISYLQELTLSNNTFYKLQIFGHVSPRYMNNIPIDKFIKFNAKEPIAVKGSFQWSFNIKLKTTQKVSFFNSPTHKINLIQSNLEGTENDFEMAQNSIPNKDFIFLYTVQNFEEPSYILSRTDHSSTAMIFFIPKFCTLALDDAYKAEIDKTSYETEISGSRGEYLFLLDRSGSMDGKRMDKAKEALILFLKSLPEDSYFNVMSFGSKSQSLFAKSQKYHDKSVQKAVEIIAKMTANMGFTEIYQPIQQLLESKLIEGYPKQIFLLTDGDVSDTQAILKLIEKNIKFARVHGIGIGNGCSEQLVRGSAEKGKGHCIFIKDSQNVSEKIIQLLTDSLSPLIHKVQLDVDKNIVQSIIPNPLEIPYILKNQIVNFYINFKGQITEKTIIKLTYEDSHNNLPYSSAIQIDPESFNESFVDKMSHFKKIKLMQKAYQRDVNYEDFMYCVKVVDKKQAIIKQSIDHQILSEFTAFVCIEKQLIDGKYQEMKDKEQIKTQIKFQEQQEQKQEEEQYEQDLDMGGLFDGDDGCDYMPKQVKKTKAIPQAKATFKPQLKQLQEPDQEDFDDANMGGLFDGDGDGGFCYGYEAPAKKVEKKTEASLINVVINLQSTNGSWKDFTLISKLYKDLALEEFTSKEKEGLAILTFLIIKWIQKYHPQKQYLLLLKKATNWCKSNCQQFNEFATKYDHLLK